MGKFFAGVLVGAIGTLVLKEILNAKYGSNTSKAGPYLARDGYVYERPETRAEYITRKMLGRRVSGSPRRLFSRSNS